MEDVGRKIRGAVEEVVQVVGRTMGSGRVVMVTPEISPFNRISISSGFRVGMRFGGEESVVIRIDEGLVDDLVAEVSGGTLSIGVESWGMKFGRATPEAEIVARKIEAVSISGASLIEWRGAPATSHFDLKSSGASRVLGQIEVDSLRAGISGASNVRLEGKAREAKLDASGASVLSFDHLELGDLLVHLSGATRAEVGVAAKIAGRLSGASRLTYRGGAALGDVATSGGSSVRAV